MFYPLNHFSHHFLMSVFHSQNMSLWSLLSKYIHWLYPFNHCIHSIYIKQFNHFPIGRFQVFFLGNAFFAYLLSNYWNLWDCVRNQKFAYCKNSHEWTKLSYNESLLKHPFCFFVALWVLVSQFLTPVYMQCTLTAKWSCKSCERYRISGS